MLSLPMPSLPTALSLLPLLLLMLIISLPMPLPRTAQLFHTELCDWCGLKREKSAPALLDITVCSSQLRYRGKGCVVSAAFNKSCHVFISLMGGRKIRLPDPVYTYHATLLSRGNSTAGSLHSDLTAWCPVCAA
jgi:hypothetical protein